MVPLDFDPPVRQWRAMLLGLTDADLAGPTPCPGWPVATLLAHVVHQTGAFTRAAGKTTAAAEPETLPQHWRSRFPVVLEELATAWKQPDAWLGTATVHGVTRSAPATALAAMEELILHGWDLARATGQDFAADPRVLTALLTARQNPKNPDISGTGNQAVTGNGSDPGHPAPTDYPDDESTLLDQLIAATGRDPRWRPGLSARSTRAAG